MRPNKVAIDDSNSRFMSNSNAGASFFRRAATAPAVPGSSAPSRSPCGSARHGGRTPVASTSALASARVVDLIEHAHQLDPAPAQFDAAEPRRVTRDRLLQHPVPHVVGVSSSNTHATCPAGWRACTSCRRRDATAHDCRSSSCSSTACSESATDHRRHGTKKAVMNASSNGSAAQCWPAGRCAKLREAFARAAAAATARRGSPRRDASPCCVLGRISSTRSPRPTTPQYCASFTCR